MLHCSGQGTKQRRGKMPKRPPQICGIKWATIRLRVIFQSHVIRRERWWINAAAAALKDHFKTIRVIFREANPTGQVFIAGSFARIPVLINDRQDTVSWARDKGVSRDKCFGPGCLLPSIVMLNNRDAGTFSRNEDVYQNPATGN
ncbi:hypothetical protein M0804_008181 [Polistes exclamans]|nr:hypothetical protein M0804_008181 [Polistes exclamans]